MGFPRDEGKTIKFKKARTNRGKCIYCHGGIWPGEEYIEGVGGSKITHVGVVHKKCCIG